MVLGRGPNHRRAADVDLLDRFFEGDGWSGDRLDERIEVAADEVDLAQAVLAQRFDVRRTITSGQDPRVHPRVESLDAPIHHLGKSGQLGHRARVKRGIFERTEGAARREELVAEPLQASREGGEACLVANRQKG